MISANCRKCQLTGVHSLKGAQESREQTPRSKKETSSMSTMEYRRATGSRLVGSRSVKSPGTEMPIIVLIVEDEALVRETAVDVLGDAGFQVLEAGNGHDALALLESNPDVRVLFTDLNMPGSMDGLMLAFMASVRWPHLALILSSGNMPPK